MKTPRTDDIARGNHVVPTEWAEELERELDDAYKIARRAIDDLAWFNETNAQRLRAELDKLKEGGK
jgi:hypothetical protein